MFNPYVQYMYSYPHKTAYRPLPDLSLKEYFPCLGGVGHGLYLHIPFCQTKCGYCNLFSVTGQPEEKMDEYLWAVERQARQYAFLLPASSAFSAFTIGGGTPLLLNENQLDRMFMLLRGLSPFSKVKEIIVETAPNQTTREKLHLLKQAGTTRVSMGIQSFSDEELYTLARQHCAEKAKKALDLLMSEGFACVNIDFIYGIPGQTRASLLSSLKEALHFSPDEIFLYPLYVKHGAGLERQIQRGLVLEPEKAYAQYQEASAFLISAGFRQDSMRRFVRVKEGVEPVRSFSDCGFGTSLALGCGGRSYLGSLHFCTPYAITQKDSLAQLEAFIHTEDFTKINHGILLSCEEQKRRYIIRHLLIYPGLDEEEYFRHFGSRAAEDFGLLEEWIEKGYLVRGDFLALTRLGLGLSDYLGPQMISAQVRQRMEEWEEQRGQKDNSLPGQLKKL